MSCDFHVYCRSCNSQHPFQDANHADRLMHTLIRHAPAIAALAPLLIESNEHIDVRVHYGPIDAAWFRNHLGHELVVRDEYGRIAGTCGKAFECSECQTRHYCRRSIEHEDACKVRDA